MKTFINLIWQYIQKNESKFLYISISFLQQILALTWVQMLYNDPSTIHSHSLGEWIIVTLISGVIVLTGTLITWKAYTSDPKKGTNNDTTPKTA